MMNYSYFYQDPTQYQDPRQTQFPGGGGFFPGPGFPGSGVQNQINRLEREVN